MTEASWCGPAPVKCDICERQLKQQFVDGKTRAGVWAIMCPTCHVRHGCGLGVGCGQRYDLKTLKKVAG